MQMGSSKAPLPSVGEFPLQISGGGIDCVKEAIVAAEIDEPMVDRGRRRDARLGGKAPTLRSRFLVDCVEIAVIAAHVNHAAGNSRRGDNFVFRRELPAQVMESSHSACVDPGMRQVVAEHRRILSAREAEVCEKYEEGCAQRTKGQTCWLHGPSLKRKPSLTALRVTYQQIGM